MKIKEIESKTCLTKSKLGDYAINPYIGCSHACVYCYADFIRRFQNIPEKWGEFVFIKKNCPMLLEKELEKSKPGHIFMSSICDCYMPLEEKYALTRKILEIISKSGHKNKFSIEILTKSSLVQRDFDLLKQLDAELGMSFAQLDEKTARVIEPFASFPKQRLETLRKAKENGIKTFGFISPVLPGMIDFDSLFRELKGAGCSYVWIELLNMRKSTLDRLMPIIKENFPEKLGDFDFAIKHPGNYFKKISEEAMSASKKYNLPVREIVRHDMI